VKLTLPLTSCSYDAESVLVGLAFVPLKYGPHPL